MTRVLIGLVLGLLLGLGIGAVAFRGGDDSATATSGAPTGASGEHRTPSEPAPLPRPESSDGDARRAAESLALAARTDPPAIERAEVAASSVAEPRGDGVIEGVVLDPKRQPVAGVLVRAIRQARDREEDYRATQTGLPANDDFEHVVREATAARGRTHEARTGPDGRYRLGELPDADYWMSAYADGWVVSAARGNISLMRVAPGSKVDFKAEPEHAIPVEVQLPDGRRAVKALLMVVPRDVGRGSFSGSFSMMSPMVGGPRPERLWTASAPRLRVLDGAYRVRAIVHEPFFAANGVDRSLASKEVDLDVEGGLAKQPLQPFRLGSRLGISGRVQIVEGDPVENIRVQVLRLVDRAEPTADAIASSERSVSASPYAPVFQFFDLEAGRWAVGARRDWNGPIVTFAVVDVQDGIAKSDLVLPPPSPEDSILVHVRDSSGRPVSDVKFRVKGRRGNSTFERGATAREADAGDFVVAIPSGASSRPAADAGVRVVPASVTVDSKRFGPQSFTLQPGQRELNAVLADPARLVLTVANPASARLKGRLRIDLNPSANDGESQRRTELASDGSVTFGAVAPGEFRISVRIDSQSDAGSTVSDPIVTQDVTLVAGDNRKTITIPPLYSLTVKLSDPDVEGVAMRLESGDTRAYRTANDGRVTFDNLCAGRWTVTTMGSERIGRMSVTLPGPSEVEFVAQPVNAMRVSISNANGLLARWGFADGDVLIAFDGAEFTDEKSVERGYVTAMSKDSVKAIVLRGGRRVELTMPGKELLNREELGGQMEPTAR